MDQLYVSWSTWYDRLVDQTQADLQNAALYRAAALANLARGIADETVSHSDFTREAVDLLQGLDGPAVVATITYLSMYAGYASGEMDRAGLTDRANAWINDLTAGLFVEADSP